MRNPSGRTTSPCKYFHEYKAIFEPKCNCQPCWNKWVNRIWNSVWPCYHRPMIVHVGITATRDGLSEKQKLAFVADMRQHLNDGDQIVFHHGDCIGGDAEADAIMRNLDIEYPNRVMFAIHPPINAKYRAFCAQPGDIVNPEKHYIARDHDIVDAVDEMYGGPKDHQREEFRGSGTWTTVRYARERMKTQKWPRKLTILERY